MADVDLTTTTPYPGGATVRVTMDSTIGAVRRVLLPPWPSKITMAYTTSGGADEDGYFEFTASLADGDMKTSAAFKVPSGSPYQRWLAQEGGTPSGGAIIYLAGSSISGHCHLDLEP